MEVGDKVKFPFGNTKEKKEGVVVRLFPKSVVIRADFENHKGKIIRRKRHQVS